MTNKTPLQSVFHEENQKRLDQVYANPGYYVCVGHGAFVIHVHKTHVQQCHPFPPFRDDGPLTRDGWNTNDRALIFLGPFALVKDPK